MPLYNTSLLASKLKAQMIKIIGNLPYIAPIHSTLYSYFSIPFRFLLPISQGSKTARLSWPVSCECSTSTATQTGRCPPKSPVLTSQTPFRVQPSHVCSKTHFLTMTWPKMTRGYQGRYCAEEATDGETFKEKIRKTEEKEIKKTEIKRALER